MHNFYANNPNDKKDCVELATHHLRFDKSGRVIHAGDKFALGDSNYKSVCRQHYNMLYYDINQKTK